MRYKTPLAILICLFAYCSGIAQKPFTEGVIVYRVKLTLADNKSYTGIYTFTFKGPQIRKELKLNNGFQDVELLNCSTNMVYSLQAMNGKKYAIQLNMADMVKKQALYGGYVIQNEVANKNNIAGFAVYKGKLNYKDGSGADIYYTKDWYPSQAITFERFPDAKFLPLHYSYTDENNTTLEFEADKVQAGPVENGIFRIPAEYKLISNEEYKQLTR